MQHIIISPNAFKHSLTADEAAQAISTGLKNSKLKCKTTLFPIGDGGDGTCRLIHEKLRGQLKHVNVSDPLGRKIKTSYSLINKGKTAVIEMADASGIHLLKSEERNPLKATSIGTGELLLHALDQGVRQFIIGMGGSATVDGGCGILYALGVKFLDRKKNELKPIPNELKHMEYVDISGLDERLKYCEIKILCDVDNFLLGDQGAAAIFGPQKGASEKDVKTLDQFLQKFNAIVKGNIDKDMTTLVSGGTAGGAAASMHAFANAELVNGINYFLKITHFENEIKKADWLITGEGSLDEQTLSGKGPYGVAILAKKQHIRTIAFAGKIPLNPSKELLDLFPILVPINNEAVSLENALKNTRKNLQRTAEMIGNIIALYAE
ncbi:MAG TPA: glycerate kinase [Sphingobacterium sp.]|nr:glycerate kinase [Sphingobacterium sp.]